MPTEAVQVTKPEREFLKMLASRDNGECPWDWSHRDLNATENGKIAKAMVVNLINTGMCIEREYATHALDPNPRLVMRLTNKGRATVERIIEIEKQAAANATKVDSTAPETILPNAG